MVTSQPGHAFPSICHHIIVIIDIHGALLQMAAKRRDANNASKPGGATIVDSEPILGSLVAGR